METKKRGRKPKPDHLRVKMVSVYLTEEQKDLIIKEFGGVTEAIKKVILSQLYAKYATKNGLVPLNLDPHINQSWIL